ncbi:MAG: YdcF family protein [Candidatus Hodarchaeota archaeon]
MVNAILDETILLSAEKIWNYHHVNQPLEKSDCILVLGSHDTRVAERGADLFLDGWAPLLIFSGGFGNFTKDVWDEPEADKFSKIALNMGVPRDKILVENKSTNSGENIKFTRDLLERKNLHPQKFILVQKPYMERRAYATFMKVWPGKNIIVTSPQISFKNYPTNEIGMEEVIHIMLGDLQRIKLYPKMGFQIYQSIPNDILNAYEFLVQKGYTNHLIPRDEL